MAQQAIKISMYIYIFMVKHRVSQKKSATRGLCICYLKVIEGQVSLSALLGTLSVSINISFGSQTLTVTFAEHACDNASKRILNTYRLHFVRFFFPFSSQPP